MTNDYIEHYTKNQISPVRQDIINLQKHFYIREKLYQSLGLIKSFFKDRNVIEIGPGGGYNTIFTASLGPAHYELIEANEIGILEIKNNLKNFNLEGDNITIQNLFIEEFETEEKFDIAICEGMLPCVKNNFEILDKMDSLLKDNGIILITCSDEISIFFDMARRLLANILLQNNKVDTFEEKVDILVKAFGSHLDTLKGFGRLKEDWCADNLLGNALYNTNLSLSDVLEYFGNRYSFYKMSPDIIIDTTWFKEVACTVEEYNKVKIDNFRKVWHNLIHYKVFDNQKWDKNDTLQLRSLCREFIEQCRRSEVNYVDEMGNIIDLLGRIKKLFFKYSGDTLILEAIEELLFILNSDGISIQKIAEAKEVFRSSFGRGQQYITLIKEQ